MVIPETPAGPEDGVGEAPQPGVGAQHGRDGFGNMASGTLSFEAQLERIATRPVVDPVADLAVLREALVQRDGRVRHTDLLQFAEIVASLLRQVPLIQRMAFANRVAAIPIVPRPLLRQIILDHYLVSAPVLERAPMLDESDILRAMAERGDEVMLAIAKRRDISVRITDVLMAQGGRKVMLALAGNVTARISPRNLALLAGLRLPAAPTCP
eukprot:gene20068-20605_t